MPTDLFETEQKPRPMMGRGNNSFRACETCNGMGFLRQGAFAARSYPRCPVCNGLGQAYLEPVNQGAPAS